MTQTLRLAKIRRSSTSAPALLIMLGRRAIPKKDWIAVTGAVFGALEADFLVEGFFWGRVKPWKKHAVTP